MTSHTFPLADYQIHLGPLADTLPAWLRDRQYSSIFVITDENTHAHCLPYLDVLLPVGVAPPSPPVKGGDGIERMDATTVGNKNTAEWVLSPPLMGRRGGASATGRPNVTILPPGETFKNLTTCEQVWQAMLEANLDRKALVINLGGGVVGDLGGFCAATWKRGMDFIQIPTTLLSMTDAAIGGKLGIDFQGLKNVVGVFQNPAAVFADPVFLQTLPERELRSGFAEVLKHALLGNPALWRNLEALPNLEDAPWMAILRSSIAVKVHVVTEDPHEQGLRMLLNYGHTIGHAVESYFLKGPFPRTHGEAIALGMICESWLARTASPNGHNRLAQVITLLAASFAHDPIPTAAFPEIWATMQQDKKNVAGAVRLAVPGEEPYSMLVLETDAAAVADSLAFYNGLV